MSNWLHHTHLCPYAYTYIIHCRPNPDVPATADLRDSIQALRRAHVRKKLRTAIHALVAGKRVKKLSHAVKVRACGCSRMWALPGTVGYSRVLDSPIRSTARGRIWERSLLFFVRKARTGSLPVLTVPFVTRPHGDRVQCATARHPNRGRLRS
jgi:hypothetical protein